MATINSVLGPMDTADLGFTLPHEHLIDSSAGVNFTYGELVDREWALETAVADLTQAHIEGVDTIVEVSPLDLGREVSLMKEVSQRSGVQFICCTGCWLDVPRSFWGRTPEFIAALWSREIEEGIDGTGIKAGIIKVATSDPISEHEELMLRSAFDSPLSPRPLSQFGQICDPIINAESNNAGRHQNMGIGSCARMRRSIPTWYFQSIMHAE